MMQVLYFCETLYNGDNVINTFVMNYKTIALATLLFFGAGCAQAPAEVNSSPGATTTTGATVSTVTVPPEGVLLPKNKTWQRVTIKNFVHPYSFEIHPWWFWRGTKKELQAGGALFASNAMLLGDGGRSASGTKVIWYGASGKSDETFEKAVSAALIKECNVLRSQVNGFEICAGNVGDKDSFVRAVAFKKDGDYVWQPLLDYGVPFGSGLGYFLHMVATFQPENVTK